MAGKFRKWELWTVNVKYEDTEETKFRPVVIINKDGNIYACAAKVTSHDARNQDGEYPIKFWEEAGLNKKSVIRLSQMYRLHEDDLIFYIGRLKPADIMGIIDMLKENDNCVFIPQ